MPSSFLDYLDVPEIQAAIANVRATQQRFNLAVQPKPALAPVVQSALQNQQAGQTLAIGAGKLKIGGEQTALEARRVALESKRLDLEQQQREFEKNLEPAAIGIGALTLGSHVVGAVRESEATEEMRKTYGALADLRTQQGTYLQDYTTRVNARLADLEARQRKAFQSPATPLAPVGQ